MLRRYALLPERGLIRIEGPDSRDFLQGLVSNDVSRVGPGRAVYAALLTPQGKFLHDFFIVEHEGALWLDCEAARRADLQRRLTLYKLRAKVALADAGAEFAVAALFGEGVAEAVSDPPEPGRAIHLQGGVAYVDPRLAALGARAILPAADAAQKLAAAGFDAATAEEYDRHRLALGVPDGSRDLEVEKALLLENNFEELHGVDFQKGCYVGQELTARTKYRALIRKRLMPVRVEGPMPTPGTPLMRGEREAGIMRSGRDDIGLALLKLEEVEAAGGEAFTAGDARVRPFLTHS